MNIQAAYRLEGQAETQSGQSYTAANTDQSAIYVLNGGSLTLRNAAVATSGGSSSSDNSSFYGLNAAVLAGAGGTINMADSTVSTTGDGANGVFAAGSGAAVTLSNSRIDCSGQYAHAVMATLGGVMTLSNVDMRTSGANSGAVATDRGSGSITMDGGSAATSGADSPGIYSTGVIRVTDASISSTGAEAAVIEGANSIDLENTVLVSSVENKWGVMIYQSFSGDAEGSQGAFRMTGGKLAYTSSNGPLFYVTNATGIINLQGVEVNAGSGVLAQAAAGKWGAEGSNGGELLLTADAQALSGDVTADAISSLSLTLQNGSTLSGAINPNRSAAGAALTLDASSTWNVTADSYLTTLNDAAGISGTSVNNVIGNGYTVYYDVDENPALGGQTFTLKGGGALKPAG